MRINMMRINMMRINMRINRIRCKIESEEVMQRERGVVRCRSRPIVEQHNETLSLSLAWRDHDHGYDM